MNIIETIEKSEKRVETVFKQIDKIKEINQEKVLEAFREHKVGAQHFFTVSGYGHDDLGREVIDRVFATTFRAEKAVVRNHFVSGTHALACCLLGNLRYGEKLVSVVGSPYDTMEEVIGKRGDKRASLMGHGVLYDEVALKEVNGVEMVDLEAIEKKLDSSVNMILIHRSRGFSFRKSLCVDEIGEIVKIAKRKNPDCICFVDNCYGEFVEDKEPLEVGADLIAGSLIKNPGGGIVEAGGYIAGKQKLVDYAAQQLTAPGIGAEGGAMMNQSRLILQGFFMSPSIVAEALKGAVLAAAVFEDIGFISTPKPQEKRCDIIQTIKFGAPEPLLAFCRAVQAYSPIESYLTPIPDEVVGYEDKLIMAGGSFIEGSTIELSADGPLRPPYAAYMQGGLNYAHVNIVLKKILQSLSEIKAQTNLSLQK